MTEPRIWQICLGSGFAMFTLAIIALSAFPDVGGPYPAGYGDPIYALEFARSKPEVLTVIGARENHTDFIAAVTQGTYWDFGFIIAFGTFLASFFIALFRRTHHQAWLCFAVLGLLTAGADAVENVIILGLLPRLDTLPNLEFLFLPVTIKFIGLGLTILGGAAYLLSQKRLIRRIEGAAALICGAGVLIALIMPSKLGWMFSPLITIGWLAMLAFAATQALKKPKLY